MRHQMRHRRRDGKQRQRMAGGDQPERRRVHGFARGEVAVDRSWPNPRRRMRFRRAVRHFALGVRTMVNQLHQRQPHQQHDQRGNRRRPPPAEQFQAQKDDGHPQPAERKAELRHRDGLGAVSVEPVDDGDGERREAAQPRTNGDDRPSQIERENRIGKREQQEPASERRQPDAQNQPRPEAIHQPALQRPKQPALHPSQRERPGHERLAPPEVPLHLHRVGPEGMHQQQPGEQLDASCREHHPPAVEHPTGRPDNVIDAGDERVHAFVGLCQGSGRRTTRIGAEALPEAKRSARTC